MQPTVSMISCNLVDISVRLEDDCVFGFTVDREELEKLISDLQQALDMQELNEHNWHEEMSRKDDML